MTDKSTKLDWIPLYIQRLKGSEAWGLPDYQFCWYFKLLIESADSPIPGYLPGSLDKLWRLAGAKSQSYFEKWGGCELVSRLFCRTEIEGQTWIYNKRMLQIIYEQSEKLTKRTRKRSLSLSMSLQSVPKEVNPEVFNQYIEMREKIKKPMTGNAIILAFKKLEKLKEQGQDPNAVLEQSIFNSWQGLFPVTQNTVTNGKPSTSAAREQRIRQRTEQVLGAISSSDAGAVQNGNGRRGISGLAANIEEIPALGSD